MIQQEPPTSTPIPLWAIFVAAGVPAVFVVLLLIAVIVLVIKLRRTQRANAERQHMLTDQENEYWSNTEYYQMETDRVPNASNRIRTVRYSGTPIDDDLSPELNRALANAKPQLKNVNIQSEELTLEEQIGEGSNSVVFKAAYMGVTVAVKRCVIIDLLDDPLQDFIKETTIMSKLRHPNVVSFLGASIKERYFYIISEYCDNGSLEKYVHPERPNSASFRTGNQPTQQLIKLSLPVKYKMLLDAALGLLYLSKQNILHRDVKLANLLVDKHWTIKLGDFGVSRVLEKDKKMTYAGTVETCAPEVLENDDYSFKSDVYSFGIIMWELCFEKPLYSGLDIHEIKRGVVEQDLRPTIPSHSKVDPRCVQLMQQCWQKDKNKRPDFGQCVTILKVVVEEQGEFDMPVSQQTRSASKRDALVLPSQVAILDRFGSVLEAPLESRVRRARSVDFRKKGSEVNK